MSYVQSNMRAAVVGAGPHGRRILAALERIGVEIAAVIDRREEALQALEVGPSVIRSAGTAVLRDRIDLTCIATNGPSHCALAIEAMEAGSKYVMIEKPMACSAAECDRMIAVADRLDVRLSVDNSRRHDPMYRWLRAQIRSGRWGELRTIAVQRPGGGLGCLGSHSFDLASFLSDRRIERVSGWLDPVVAPNPRGTEFEDPGGLVVIELEGGARALITQIEDGAGPMSVEINLTGARIQVDEKEPRLEILERDLTTKPGPGRPPKHDRIAPPKELALQPDLAVMLDGVLSELAGGGPMDCTAGAGRASVEALVGAHLSHRRGHLPVKLPLEGEERGEWLPVT